MDNFLWVLGFIAKNVVQGFIVGGVAAAILWFLLHRGTKGGK